MRVEAVTLNSPSRANCGPTVIHIPEATATSVYMQAATNHIANPVT